jgi:hypothetical protein
MTTSIGPGRTCAPGFVLDGLPGEGVMAVSIEASVAGVVRAAGGPTVNTNGVVEWGVKNIIPLLLLIIGISIIASARKGRMSENANTLTNVVIGSAVIGSAALLFAFATSLSNLLFGG